MEGTDDVRIDESHLAPSQRRWCADANRAGVGCDIAQLRLQPRMDDGRLGNGA